jgi:hypothetical protein
MAAGRLPLPVRRFGEGVMTLSTFDLIFGAAATAVVKLTSRGLQSGSRRVGEVPVSEPARSPKEDAEPDVIGNREPVTDFCFDRVSVFNTPYGPDLFPWWDCIDPPVQERSETGKGVRL